MKQRKEWANMHDVAPKRGRVALSKALRRQHDHLWDGSDETAIGRPCTWRTEAGWMVLEASQQNAMLFSAQRLLEVPKSSKNAFQMPHIQRIRNLVTFR
jgi:hypothetical protein